MERGRLVAVLRGDDVRGLAPTHRVHVAVAPVDHEVAPRHEERSDAADPLDGHVAALVHVRDDEADLVGVSGDGDERSFGGSDLEPEVAERVTLGVTERCEAAAHDVLHGRLEPGGSGREAELAQQLQIGARAWSVRAHPALLCLRHPSAPGR